MGWPKGKPRPAEIRRRMSEASRKAWADPEVRRRMSEARRKAWAARSLGLTEEQRRLYVKLRPIVGRDAALAEVRRSI